MIFFGLMDFTFFRGSIQISHNTYVMQQTIGDNMHFGIPILWFFFQLLQNYYEWMYDRFGAAHWCLLFSTFLWFSKLLTHLAVFDNSMARPWVKRRRRNHNQIRVEWQHFFCVSPNCYAFAKKKIKQIKQKSVRYDEMRRNAVAICYIIESSMCIGCIIIEYWAQY